MRCFRGMVAALAAVATLTPVAVAQNLEPGIHASLNAATFSGESSADFSLRGSLGAGLSLGIPVTSELLFQPEIRYVIKGANGKNARVEGVADGLDIESTISYLEIPLLLVFRIDRDGRIRPRVFGGVYGARNLDATIEWRLPAGGPTQSESDDSVVENDYGLVFGGGLDIDVAGEAVVVGGRVSIGLTDIRDRPDAPLRNRAFEVFVGLLMR